MNTLRQTDQTTLHRKPQRGSYDRELIHGIIDQAILCHVGVVHDGDAVVIPMIHGRIGDTLYLHGSTKSRLLLGLCAGSRACVTFTLLDALVLARTALHHSMNYRSAVLFGAGRTVIDVAEKRAALEAIVEHVIAGRWSELPESTPGEVDATAVCAIAIDEASAKVRTGGANDGDASDYPDVWAGQLPLVRVALEPIADPSVPGGLALPASVLRIRAGDGMPAS